MTAQIRIAAAALILLGSSAHAQDSLAPVRDLYASAAYEDALSVVARLTVDGNANEIVELDRYRALCLMALGRTAEADKVIEAIALKNPIYQPPAADTSPRVRAAFGAVRQRVLPGIARNLYVDAKAAFDRKAYAEAVATLEKVIAVIDDVDVAHRADLSDLRTLASGFLDLSRASLPPATVVAPAPDVSTATPHLQPVTVAPPQTTNLVVLKQHIPPLPFTLTSGGIGEYRGVVEVEIDETGSVTSAKIIEPIHGIYDPLLLKAARDWKYEPPRIGGKPSASRKRVEIVLRP